MAAASKTKIRVENGTVIKRVGGEDPFNNFVPEVCMMTYLEKTCPHIIPEGFDFNTKRMEITMKEYSGNLFDFNLIDYPSYLKDTCKKLIGKVCELNLLGVSHCDIKPVNAVISFMKDGEVDLRLIDFEAAKYQKLVDLNTVKLYGTNMFKSPELLAGKIHSLEANDIWATALSVYLINLSTDESNEFVANPAISVNLEKYIEDENLGDLLAKMLDPNPVDRITVRGILQHPYMRDYQLTPPIPIKKVAPFPCQNRDEIIVQLQREFKNDPKIMLISLIVLDYFYNPVLKKKEFELLPTAIEIFIYRLLDCSPLGRTTELVLKDVSISDALCELETLVFQCLTDIYVIIRQTEIFDLIEPGSIGFQVAVNILIRNPEFYQLSLERKKSELILQGLF